MLVLEIDLYMGCVKSIPAWERPKETASERKRERRHIAKDRQEATFGVAVAAAAAATERPPSLSGWKDRLSGLPALRMRFIAREKISQSLQNAKQKNTLFIPKFTPNLKTMQTCAR
eukprot:COSAG05_NODE_3787_length_1836_cov_2.100173_5_plen_116_part_00